ncbi:Universal stress protein family protein, partial [Sphingobium faniae]
MTKILACIDASAYAASVCDLAAWASKRLDLPVELLHVVQRALLQRLAAVRGRLSLCADQAAAAKWWLSMP